MNLKSAFAVLTFLCALASISSGEPRNERGRGLRSIEDVRSQIVGTSWKAVPRAHLRDGMAPVITFTEKTVAPKGYAYDANARDSLTIIFNHGDKQLMLLSPDGKRLKFTFRDREYSYELVSKE